MQQPYLHPTFAQPERRGPRARVVCVLLLLAGLAAGLRGAAWAGWQPAWLSAAGLLLVEQAVWALGLGLLAAAGLSRLRRGPARDRVPMVIEAVAWALFTALLVWIDRRALWSGLHGSGDHLMHQLLARFTEANLWQHGAWRGWCSAVGMGIPLNDLYPPGGNLLVVAARLLTAYLVSFERVYVWVVLLAYLGFAALLYRIVRRESGWVSALLIPLLLALDSGNWYFGWYSVFEQGLWAIVLGLGLALNAASLYAAPKPLGTRGSGELIASVAASVLLHPLYLVFYALWVALDALWRALPVPHATRLPAGLQVNRLACLLLGLGATAFWWAPFAASREWIMPYGFWGRFMPELGRLVIEGGLFRGAQPYLAFLALAGAVWGLASGRRFLQGLALVTGACLFLGTEPARQMIAHPRAAEFFEHMQVERLYALAKGTGLVLGAVFLGEAVRWLLTRPACLATARALSAWIEDPPPARNRGAAFFALLRDLRNALLILLALIPPVMLAQQTIDALWRWQIVPAQADFYARPDRPFDWQAMQAVQRVLQAQLEAEAVDFMADPLPPARLYTQDAWKLPYLSAHAPLAVMARGYQPATLLGTRPWFISPWLMRHAPVHYVLSQKADPVPERPALSGLEPVYENAAFVLYRNPKEGQASSYLRGAGQMERLPDAQGALRWRIRGVDENAWVRLPISNYRKWQATLNGEPLETLLPARHGEHEEAWKLIGLRVRDGVLTLRYGPQPIDIGSAWASLGLLVLAVGWATPFWQRRLQRRAAWPRLLNKAVDGGAVLAVLAALALLPGQGPAEAPQPGLRYLGQYADQVGSPQNQPDGRNDWIFELRWTHRQDRGGIEEVVLQPLDATGAPLAQPRWRSHLDGDGRVGVMDMLGRRADRQDGTIDAPPARNQRWLLFLPVPESLAAPQPFRFRCTLRFADGSQKHWQTR